MADALEESGKKSEYPLDKYFSSLSSIHRYSLTQLDTYLNDLNLEFQGFELPDAHALRKYRERFPGDADATTLSNWHSFEQDNPDTFSAMYQFWAVKR